MEEKKVAFYKIDSFLQDRIGQLAIIRKDDKLGFAQRVEEILFVRDQLRKLYGK